MSKSDLKNSFEELITKDRLKNIENIYKNINKNDEFEFMFFNYKKDMNNMTMETFLKILSYLTHRGKKLSIKKEVTLDISYSETKTRDNYRITINELKNINRYIKMLHLRKNHVIFKALVNKLSSDKSLSIIKKIKKKENIVDIDEFDIRARLSQEKEVTKSELDMIQNIASDTRKNIIFRYKQRTSLFLVDNADVTMRIDLTDTKMSDNINNILKKPSIFELEIEIVPKKSSPKMSYLSDIYKEITILIKIIQQSNFIITVNEKNNVLKYYNDLLNLKDKNLTTLDGRKPQSLEIQHVVDNLPNKYAVTDKADGERFFIIIKDRMVFLISFNLDVKNTGIVLPSNKSSYNGTILDGEYLFIAKKNRHLFMAFDILKKGDDNVKEISSFMERQEQLQKVIEDCFILGNQKGYKFKKYNGKMDMDDIVSFHSKEITAYHNALNNDIGIETRYPLIRSKYFMDVFGAKNNEIYKYSQLLWKKYVFDKEINCPYTLDGLVYHPLDQKYTTSEKESINVEYKWKPPEKNSIDFYIEFEKNPKTGKPVIIYDNSVSEFVSNKPYKIVNLFVGDRVRGIEKPILFQEEKGKHMAHLFLRDGEVRDIEGNIIQDKTVVEFYYNNDATIPPLHRWIPITTRHDKTESVIKFQKKYGNFVTVANKIWRSISNPFLISDIDILSKSDDSYRKHIDVLRGKIDHSIILETRKESAYYEKVTNLGKNMRAFHNFLKSIIIYTYCSAKYEDKNKLSVLDYACGRGGDLMKFYYVSVDYYVGIDIDNDGIISPINGAISRYNKFRRGKPNFPRMSFIQGDIGAPINYEDQMSALGSMSSKNKELLEKFFPADKSKQQKFDRINCQFAIHYLFENETKWNNLLDNINTHLKPGGQILLTTFDGDRIMKLLKDKDQYTAFYTDKAGEKKVFFEIVKKYEDKNLGKNVGLGHAIDVYNAMISQEGKYMTEYIVQKDFLVKEFLEKCGLELLDSDLFENQYRANEDFIKNYSMYESNPKTRKFLESPIPFYDLKDDENLAAFKFSRLSRYYVFRKKTNFKAQKGGSDNSIIDNSNIDIADYSDISINNMRKYFTSGKYIRREFYTAENNTFMNGVYDVLKNDGIIPESLKMSEFYDDIKFKEIEDNKLDSKTKNKLSEKINIAYEYTETDMSEEVGLKNPNIFIISNSNRKIEAKNYSNNGKFNPSNKSIVFYKSENNYFPIYKAVDDNFKGIFSSNDDLIKKLIK